MVIDLLGMDDDNVRLRAAEFARETRGNPFLLIELVGCFDPESDSFEPLPLHEVLDRKLGRLPAEAGRLLEVVAVSGQALSLEEASKTAGHLVPSVATITRMRNERLVRLIGPDDCPMVDTYHDRVRETVLARMDDDTSKTIHRTMAEVIEQGAAGQSAESLSALEHALITATVDKKTIPRVYDLAYHFDAAGEKRKAWIYALLAAEQARRQSALEVATNNFAIARRNLDAGNTAIRSRIAEGYGKSLMLLGRYDEAARQLEGAVDLVDDVERKTRIEVINGEILFKQGYLDKSIAFYERGLRRVGVPVPRTRLGFIGGTVREAVIQTVHSYFPRLIHRQSSTSKSELVIDLFTRLTHPYSFQSSLKVMWVDLIGTNTAERMAPSADLAYKYAGHACILSMLGWDRRGSRYGEKAIAIAESFDDVWVQAQCYNYRGVGLYASARYEEGLVRLNQAINAFGKAGDLWELNLARFHKGCCHFGLGNLAEAVKEARWVFAASARLGDSRTLCSSYLWARATRGNIPFEEIKGCFPSRPDDVMSTVHGIMAEGHWHSFHGRTEEALHAFERAAAVVWSFLCVNMHTSVVVPALARALRCHADAIRNKDGSESQRLRNRAYRLAQWSDRMTRIFPAARPMALRELSTQLAERGNLVRALRVADDGCLTAERQKARYEHAQSLLVRGKIARQLGRPEAEEQIKIAEAALDLLEKPVERESCISDRAW